MRVKLNDNLKVVRQIRRRVKENDGFCPCRLTKTEDTKCMCKEFRDMVESGKPGMCHCGLFVAVDDDEE